MPAATRNTTKDYLIRLYPEDEENLAFAIERLADALGPRISPVHVFRHLLREFRRNSLNGKGKKLSKKSRKSD